MYNSNPEIKSLKVRIFILETITWAILGIVFVAVFMYLICGVISEWIS